MATSINMEEISIHIVYNKIQGKLYNEKGGQGAALIYQISGNNQSDLSGLIIKLWLPVLLGRIAGTGGSSNVGGGQSGHGIGAEPPLKYATMYETSIPLKAQLPLTSPATYQVLPGVHSQLYGGSGPPLK